MGLVLLVKKFSLLFFCLILVSGSLLSSSFAAGPQSNFASKLTADVDVIQEERTSRKALNKEEVRVMQERILRANTRDYGRSDTPPTLSKPPFKLIPN